MAWYYGTFSCGHEGRVNVIGKAEDRQYKIDKLFSYDCQDCREKKWNDNNEEAKEKSKQYDFPELTGTEKQVSWANGIRMDFYNKCEKENIVGDPVIENETESRFWIDNRYTIQKIDANMTKFVEKYMIQFDKAEQEKAIINMDSVKPTELKHEGVVEITKENNKICLRYQKDQDFIAIVKSKGYEWHDIWCKTITNTTGSFADRCAEIGHTLLQNGFAICIHDADIREKAIAGEYEPEYKRWITVFDETHLGIKWDKQNENFYSESKKLKGAKWSNPYMCVNIINYKQVEKFATDNNFRFTQEAHNKIEKYKEEHNNIREVSMDNSTSK